MELEDERFSEDENLWEEHKIPLTYDQESMTKWFNEKGGELKEEQMSSILCLV